MGWAIVPTCTTFSPDRGRMGRRLRAATSRAGTGRRAVMVGRRWVITTAWVRAPARLPGTRRTQRAGAARRTSAVPVAEDCSIALPSIEFHDRHNRPAHRLQTAKTGVLMSVRTLSFVLTCTLIAGIALVTSVFGAQSKPSADLIATLRQGGYVLVMRHASSPREVPTAQTANADNPKLERQLDQHGRAGAAAMGQALGDLKIPVGDVFTSPTYRALENGEVCPARERNPRRRARRRWAEHARRCRGRRR